MKWYYRLFRYPEVWALALVALFTRFWQIGQPGAIVFDEVYFRTFASHYLDGQYFFDIHPPFVKLLLAGFGGLMGLSPEQVLTGNDDGLMRLLPAFAGAMLVPLVYVIIRQLGLGRRMAALGGLLILLDNALLVESRFVLMDSMLLIFGMAALSCYLAMRKARGLWRWVWLLAVSVCLGALVSTKWSGLAIVGFLGVAWLIEAIVNKTAWRRTVLEGGAAISVIALMYLGSFAVHFALLQHSGPGDVFMSNDFQSTLIGGQDYDKSASMTFWGKTVELNAQMYSSQNSLIAVEHPYSSRWYTWPIETRPVYFWQGGVGPDESQSHIYLLGNPIIWWSATILVLSAFFIRTTRPELLGKWRRITTFLLIGYAVNFLPFAFINRPMFLYHYLFALLFAILITCVIASLLLDGITKTYSKKAMIFTYWGIVVAVLVGFLYFVPISYGWPLTPTDLARYMWLPSWR